MALVDKNKVRAQAQQLVQNQSIPTFQEEQQTTRRHRTVVQPQESGSIATVTLANLGNKSAQTGQSARQRLLSQQDQPASTGAQTTRQILANINQTAQTDPERAKVLYNSYLYWRQDPSKPIYSPYDNATNKAIAEIGKLGVDVSGGVNADWIERNKGLLAYARYTTTGTSPAAPTTKSSAGENAAYWYYQIAKAEEKTQRAENEWAALKEQIAFLANDKVHNYTDQEILDRIDWRQYSTLVDMDESKSLGVPMTLNRGIGYTQDNLYGAIWAARNGDSGNDTMNSVNYTLGKGNQYKSNKDTRELWDATSANYNPYQAGSTMDDVREYFNTSEFSQAWLDQNRWMLNSDDATLRKMYGKVYEAEQTTQQAERELQAMNEYLSDIMEYTTDADIILDGLFDEGDYKTLRKMTKSLENGELLDTTRALNFKQTDIERKVREQCEKKAIQLQGDAYPLAVLKTLGVTDAPVEADTSVKKQKTSIIDRAGAFIAQFGTPSEKEVWKTAGSAYFEDNVNKIYEAIQTGEMDVQTGYDKIMDSSNKYATTHWLQSNKAISDYEAQQEELTKARQELAAVEAAISASGTDVNTAIEESEKPLFTNPDEWYEAMMADQQEKDKYKSYNGNVDLSHRTPMNTNSLAEAGWDVDPDGIATVYSSTYTVTFKNGEKAVINMTPILSQWPTPLSPDELQAYVGELETQKNAKAAAKFDKKNKGLLISYEVVPKGADEKEYIDRANAQMEQLHLEQEAQYETDQNAANIEKAKELRNKVSNIETWLGNKKDEYEESKKNINLINRAYETAAMYAELCGADVSEVDDARDMLDILSVFDHPYNPEFSSFSVFDMMMQQGASYKSVASSVDANIEQNQNSLDAITQLECWAQANGVDLSDYQYRIDTVKAELERNIQDAHYFQIQGNDDFDSVVKQTRRDILDSGFFNKMTNWKAARAADINAYLPEEQGLFGAMTDGERDTYLYLYGKMGEEAAEEYFSFLEERINTRMNEQQMQNVLSLFGGEIDNVPEALVATGAAILMSPAQVAGGIYAVGQMLQDKQINPNNMMFASGQLISMLKGQSKDTIVKSAGDDMLLKTFASVGYDVATSALESAYAGSMAMGAGLTKVGAFEGIAKFANAFKGAAIQGSYAFGTSFQDTIARGGTPMQAVELAGIQFLAETVTEAIELSDIVEHLDNSTQVKQVTRKAILDRLGQIIDTYQLDDAAGEALSQAIEDLSDAAIMNELSNKTSRIEELEASGYTTEQAEEQYWKEFFGGMAYAGLTGALSAGLSNFMADQKRARLESREQSALEEVFHDELYPHIKTPQQLQREQGGENHWSPTGKRRTDINQSFDNPVEIELNGKKVSVTGIAYMEEAKLGEGKTEDGSLDVYYTTKDGETIQITRDQMTPELDQKTNEAKAQADAQAPAEKVVHSETQEGDLRALTDDQETLAKRVSALLETNGTQDLPSHTSTIAAVLSGGDESGDMHQIAIAASEALVNEYNTDVAAGVAYMLLLGNKAGISQTDMLNAITFASLSDGDSHAMLGSCLTGADTSADTLRSFIQAADVDMQNPQILDSINTKVADSITAGHVRDIVGEGGLSGLAAYQSSVRQAKQNLKTAEDNLEQAHAAKEAADQNLADATETFVSNPGDSTQLGAQQQATKDAEGKAIVVTENEQSVANNQRNVEEAMRILREKTDEIITQVRQQAQERAASDSQARAEAAQANAQARVEQAENAREGANATRLDADNFINQYYPDATEEEKEKIRARFEKMSQESNDPDKIANRARFIDGMQKKFGIKINIADTSEGGTKMRVNGFYDPKTNSITLDTVTTQSDIIYAVALHEMTHMAERSGLYNELASSITRMAYGDDSTRLAADIRAKQQMYNAQLALMKQTDPTVDDTPLTAEDASREIVADLTKQVLFGNEEYINKLCADSPSVAQRMLNSIKSFIKKMTGTNDPAIDQLKKTQALFEKALKEGAKNNDNNRTQYFLAEFEDGKRFVDVQADQSEFDGLSWEDAQIKAREILHNKFVGKVIGIDNPVFFNGRKSHEYTYVRYTDIGKTKSMAKLRASSELDNLVDAGRDQTHKEDGLYGHTHKNATGGYDYYQTLFKVGDRYYEGKINVELGPKGRLLKDITNIKDVTEDTTNSYGENPKFRFLRDISMPNTIPETEKNSNTEIKNSSGETLVTQSNDDVVSRDYSLVSWTPAERARVRNELEATGKYTPEQIDQWIDNIDSVASQIAADKTRLDYKADPDQDFMKPNADYVVTLDASTLCAKRLLYQGTFNEIQKRLPNTALKPGDLIDLTTMMKEEGYVTPCAICYVESRRQNLGNFAQRFLDEAFESKDGYTPTLADLTNTDKLAELKKAHPKAYEDYIEWMNGRGTMNPKVVQLRTDYRGDLKRLTPANIGKIMSIGGVRIQSFSDFEVPHMIDVMQAIMDMSSMGLTSQAYTKVPEFAWVFGDTGIKINCSLMGLGTGVDENGNLIFDDVEGMPHEQAFALRQRYGKNVGTILVGMNDQHILAAMADDRIDFIIPFHRYGWSEEQMSKMPTLNTYSDYQHYQTEKRILGRKTETKTFKSLDTQKARDFMDRQWITGTQIEQVNGKYQVTVSGYEYAKLDGPQFSPVAGAPTADNVNPEGYWDFSKTGKENAERYLKMCAEDGRLPKFWEFLVDNGDGSFSLQPDGSTDGYWKTLTDFRMYDNEGVGAPQMPVQSNFNMQEANRILNEYHPLGADVNTLPVADDIVDKYVEKYKAEHPRTQYSLPQVEYTDEEALKADMRTGTYGDHKQYSLRVNDPGELDFLNNQQTITTYKTMQLIDGKLYPPMAAVVAGKTEDYSELGSWEKATEHPELIKNGNKFNLNKGKGQGSLDAAYNPYMHSSNLMINDQFSGAYARPNLVTVECEVPVSELDSGYHAEFAKDSVGWHSWHTGTVAGQLRNQKGIERQVFLSRWIKPVRIVPDSEVAQHYKELVNGTNIQVPDNVVYPSLLTALKDAGVPIKESGRLSYSLPSDSVMDDQIRQYLRGGMSSPDIQYAKTAPAAPQNAPKQNLGRPKESPYRIARNLTKTLGVGDYIGTKRMNIRKGVLGYYQTKAQYIVTSPQEAGVFTTTMHEIGHAIAAKINMTGNAQMVRNLVNAPRFPSNAYQAHELPGEAFAEFMWRYMEDEQSARSFAGDAFVNQFEDALRSAGISKDVHDAAMKLRQWVNASTNDKLSPIIKSKSDTPRSPIGERIRHVIASVVDDTSAAEGINHKIRQQKGKNPIRLDEDVRSNALAANFAGRKASALLTGELRDTQNNRIGKSLTERFKDCKLHGEQDYDMLSKYMLAKHSLARDAQGKPVFDASNITMADRLNFIHDIETNHPKIAKAAQEFQDYRRSFLQAWLVDTGFISQEFFDRLNQMYPDYVPTYRVQDGNKAHKGMSKSGYQIRSAKGSTQDIINPIESFAEMVSSIVNMVQYNNTKLAWHNAFQRYDGMGEFGRELKPDVEYKRMDMTAVQTQVASLLKNNVSNDVMDAVLKAIGKEQVRVFSAGKVNMDSVIEVQHPDGSKSFYEITDPDLFKLLSGADAGGGEVVAALSKTIGRLTRGMSALTTGSNPLFAIRNFLRDYQNSVNYGSWSSNYLTGTVKWLWAAKDVWFNRGQYKDYLALGGGGWTRIDTRSHQGVEDLRGNLIKGADGQNILQKTGSKLWSWATLERINEVIEQTSRYVEYRFGKHDKSTYEGQMRAFLAGQEATVDFARGGNSAILPALKQIVPFIGASTQGVYRTGRMFTEAERSRLPARLAKTFFNTALTSALCAGLLLKHFNDDDKEAFENMSDDLKAGNFFIPNFAPEVFGQQPLLRIPVAQDPFMYAIHGGMTNAMWNGSTDENVVEIAAIANQILDNLNVVSGGPVWSAFSDVAANRTWFGSRIVPSRMDSWESSTRYTEETPDAFIAMSRWLNVPLNMAGASNDVKNYVSPFNLQYLAEQYTGYVGQLVIPALKKNADGSDKTAWEMVQATKAAAQKRLTTDPLVSNEVVGAFYDGKTFLNQIKTAVDNKRPLNMLNISSQEEANAAYADVLGLLGKGGVVAEVAANINDLYDEIDRVERDGSMTPEDKYQLTKEYRRQICEEAIRGNEEIQGIREKYVTGPDLGMHVFAEGAYGQSKKKQDPVEKVPDVFKEDSEQPYMQRAMEVYEATGKASALPHPSYTFSSNHVEYEVAEEDQDEFNTRYKIAYVKSINKSMVKWDLMTDDEKLDALTSAHNAGRDAAKKWYLKLHKNK